MNCGSFLQASIFEGALRIRGVVLLFCFLFASFLVMTLVVEVINIRINKRSPNYSPSGAEVYANRQLPTSKPKRLHKFLFLSFSHIKHCTIGKHYLATFTPNILFDAVYIDDIRMMNSDEYIGWQ